MHLSVIYLPYENALSKLRQKKSPRVLGPRCYMVASSHSHASAVLHAGTHEQETCRNLQGNYSTHYGNKILKILV
jgi:hypothetical protein